MNSVYFHNLSEASFRYFNNTYLEAPSGYEKIKDNALSNYSDLKTLIIPEGYLSIGKNAFANCINLEKVILPSSLLPPATMQQSC